MSGSDWPVAKAPVSGSLAWRTIRCISFQKVVEPEPRPQAVAADSGYAGYAVAHSEKIKGVQNYVFAYPISAGGNFALDAFHVSKSPHSVWSVLWTVLQTQECSHLQIKRSTQT